MGVRINEVNLFVKDVEPVRRFYKDVLGLEPFNEHIGMEGTPAVCKEIMYRVGDVILTVVAPIGPESVLVNRSLEKRGEGFNHFRLMFDDLTPVLQKCKAAGIRTIGQSGGRMQEGDKIGFIDPRSAFGTLLEIAEKSYIDEYMKSFEK